MRVSFDTAIELFSLRPKTLERYCRWCFGPSWSPEHGIDTELLVKPYGDNVTLIRAVVNKQDVLVTNNEARKIFHIAAEHSVLEWGRRNPDAVIRFPVQPRFSFLKIAAWREGVKSK